MTARPQSRTSLCIRYRVQSMTWYYGNAGRKSISWWKSPTVPLEFDRETKLARYAAAGIPEVWIANLVDGQVEAYDDPMDGAYQNLRTAAPEEKASARESFPDVVLAVSDFLPEREG